MCTLQIKHLNKNDRYLCNVAKNVASIFR